MSNDNDETASSKQVEVHRHTTEADLLLMVHCLRAYLVHRQRPAGDRGERVDEFAGAELDRLIDGALAKCGPGPDAVASDAPGASEDALALATKEQKIDTIARCVMQDYCLR